MINTDLTRKAMKLAFDAHMGQVDKVGVPYIFHPAHVAESMKTEYGCCAALLHDVVEDTNVTFEDLEKDFPKEVVDALRLLTHEEGVDYMDYVSKIKDNEIAREVKIADLTHNSDSTRLITVTDVDRQRLDKYKRALEYLEN